MSSSSSSSSYSSSLSSSTSSADEKELATPEITSSSFSSSTSALALAISEALEKKLGHVFSTLVDNAWEDEEEEQSVSASPRHIQYLDLAQPRENRQSRRHELKRNRNRQLQKYNLVEAQTRDPPLEDPFAVLPAPSCTPATPPSSSTSPSSITIVESPLPPPPSERQRTLHELVSSWDHSAWTPSYLEASRVIWTRLCYSWEDRLDVLAPLKPKAASQLRMWKGPSIHSMCAQVELQRECWLAHGFLRPDLKVDWQSALGRRVWEEGGFWGEKTLEGGLLLGAVYDGDDEKESNSGEEVRSEEGRSEVSDAGGTSGGSDDASDDEWGVHGTMEVDELFWESKGCEGGRSEGDEDEDGDEEGNGKDINGGCFL